MEYASSPYVWITQFIKLKYYRSLSQERRKAETRRVNCQEACGVVGQQKFTKMAGRQWQKQRICWLFGSDNQGRRYRIICVLLILSTIMFTTLAISEVSVPKGQTFCSANRSPIEAEFWLLLLCYLLRLYSPKQDF